MVVLNLLLAVLAALLGSCCVAALWSLLALQGAALWLAPLAALAIVALLRFNGQPAGVLRALCASALFLGAALYAAYIEASGRIAAQLGLTLVEGLRRIGPEMAFAWLRGHRDLPDLGWYLGGLALALLAGYAWGRRSAARVRS